MAGAVDHAGPARERELADLLLTEAESAAQAIRSAARQEAAGVVAAAVQECETLDADSAARVELVRAAAASRAERWRATAADEARAETLSARRRSHEAVVAARRAAEHARAEAHEHERTLVDASDQRADDLSAAARSFAAEVRRSAVATAAELTERTALEAHVRLADARAALEEATNARIAAIREAAAMRESAAAHAGQLTTEAQLDLDLARRVRLYARRDADEVLVNAMERAARMVGLAAEEMTVAHQLVLEAQGLPVTLAPQLPVEAATSPADAPAEVLAQETTEPLLGAVELAPAAAAPRAPAPGPGLVLADREVAELRQKVAEAAREVPSPPPGPTGPLLVPVLSFGRELVLRLLVLLGLASGAWFWLWWLATGHGEWSFGSGTATALLAWVFGLSGYFFFFVCRMSRPNPLLPVPELRVAMVVTKAPAEAWEVLKSTLEAMLAQEYPRPYDVWLADERPTLETLQWCLEHDVKVSTRHGVPEYHRPTWPRRTKSKEGNLAYFYDQVGYDAYDVVVQLDADHVPAPGYLEAMARPFADPKVGYVSAPSICDANAAEGWTVRGRLYREASMHGPVQAGCNGGYAPVCIGSHYAVRTAALRDIGGLGPELAEDYSTTLWFQSAGWDGVFNIDAVAHGDGPATAEEMLVQELQWSRSLGTILVRWAPGRLRTVQWRARPRLAFALLYYPVAGLVVAMAAAAPMVGVLLRRSWGNTSLASFYIHLWPHTVVSMALVVYLRRCRVLRPVNGKVWSWELILFQLVRWPWTLIGFFQGVYAGLRSKVINFGVTPKSVPGARALPVRYVVPTVVLGLIPGWVVVLVRDPGPAIGLLVLAALQALVYLGCAGMVVALHLDGNRRRRRLSPSPSGQAISAWRAGGAAALATFGIVGPTLAALAWRLWVVGLRG